MEENSWKNGILEWWIGGERGGRKRRERTD
jgi:hypothetical protein